MELTENEPYLSLNMIVKNEGHIIKDTLTKLLNKVPQIDYWVISDTGSTDKTKEIILDFFKERNIKGELFDDEWKDFGHNRTKALEHAFGKSKYILVFDADDEICGDFVLPVLTKDSYHLQFGDANGTSYTRIQIVNNKKKWKYVGVLHEIITCIEHTNSNEFIGGKYYTISGKSGDRSRDGNKYLKDAAILEKAYEEAKNNNDDLYHRYGFYCANSYFDSGKREEAIKWHKLTLDNNNWVQEKYISCLKLYQCYNDLNQKETGMFYLVKAFNYDKERAECLYELVSYYCCNNLNDIAYNYYNIVKSFYNDRFLKEGLNDKLFLDVSKANFYLPYYMILVSDRVQDHDTTIQMYRIIFTKKHIERNNFFIGNMLYNLQFFIERVKDDSTFIQLFRDYIDFLISIHYPVYDHDFMVKYETYGIKIPQFSEPIFSLEECKKSNKLLFYTGYSPFKWNHTYSINNALGGSETAITCLTKNFPENYEIYVAGDITEEKVDNITYVHFNNLHNLIKNNAFHTIIVSRYLNFYELYRNFSSYQTFIWGHDVTLYAYGSDLSVESILTKWSSKITGCVCQTEWHKNLFLSSFPQLKDKFNIINNGINSHLFNIENKKRTNKFVYTSCSERGLSKLIQLWPSILENLPDAELFISSYNDFPKSDEDKRILEFIKKNLSINHLGKLNRTDLYQLMSSAEYWLYPSYFQETSCITSLELLASEVICLYYPVAGLVNTVGDYGIQISEGNEVNTLLNLSMKQKSELKKKGKQYALSCSWQNRAKEWCNMIFSNHLPILEVPLIEKNNIKVINLKRREDRKKSMIEQFERENIKSSQYEFIEAIDGNELKESEELRLLFDGNNFNYRKGIIGCALSHLQLWNTLANDNNNDYYIILEDDLELSSDFKKKLNRHCKLFEENNLEHLSLGVFECNYSEQDQIKTDEITIFQKNVYKFWNVAFGYIISKNAAKKMVSYINKCSIKCAIDNPLSHGEVLKYHHTTCCIVKQRNIHEVGTDIQHDYNNLQFTNTNNKQHLRIAYCDWWHEEYCGGSFDLNNNFITDILRKYGNISELSVVNPNDNPDVLFYSIFGNQHTHFTNVRKVFFSGEPFGIKAEADFNFTFDRNSDKNTRFPLWLGYLNNYLLEECHRRKNNVINIPKRENFCSFISNGEVKTTHRKTFVEKLSKYKKVHCGGKFLNNIGYTVPRGVNCSGKIEHNNRYKFAIAFENEDYPGYVTEKICDIYKSNCIPIYWGTKEVVNDFNPSTFINARDFQNFDELVDYIIKVDSNDELYASYFKEPMFSNKWLDAFNDPNKTFYKNLADCIIGKNTKLYDNYLSLKNNNIIKQNSAYICGCVKNCGPFLPQVFDNIKNIITLFDSYKIVIAYDNSFDNTYNYLMEMKKIYNVEIINCNNNNTRVENISSARNSILQYIRNNDYKAYEYLLMLDLDNVSCEKMNTNVIKYYLNRNDWDSLSFNTPDYSDIFALSIDPFIHSCWHWKDDNDKQVTDVVSIMRNYVQEKLSKIEKTDLLECLSAFNGLAIYRFEKFNNCNYGCDHAYNMDFLNKNIGQKWLENNIDAIENKYKLRFDEKQDCEHRIFHLEAIYKNNAKIRISPLSIFDFSSETNTLIKNNNYNTALIIEPRDDDNVTEVIFDFNKKLNKDFNNWKIVFYCGKNLETKWMDVFKDINIEIRELNTNNFTQEEYSDFCKNKNLWESLYGKFVLVFQLDTIIRNEEPYTIDYFTNLNKSYIGGNMYYNWDEFKRENIHINIRNFNGGLSLRNRSDMIKVIEEFKPENTVRPSHKMATDAEDVYFTMGCYKLNLKIGDDNVSSFFAVHSIIKDKFFGCHNPNEIKQELLNVYPEAIKNTHIYKKDFINNHFQNEIKEKFNNECNRYSDINEHLITLYTYAKDCETIIECGVRGCVSSWAFAAGLLDNNKPIKNILLNDIEACNIDEFLKVTQNTSLIVNYKWCSDLDLQVETNVDMVFIDTFHVYGQLKRELEKFSKVTNKYIIMHDTTVDEIYGECIRCGWNAEIFSSKTGFPVEEINKGLGPAIDEFLLLNPEWTLHKKYTNNNGLTILKKISPIIDETSENIKLEINEIYNNKIILSSILKIEYGIPDYKIDITNIVEKKCLNDEGIISIPRFDNARAQLFGDPLFGTVKYIFISDVHGNELLYDEYQTIIIDIKNTNDLFTTINPDTLTVYKSPYNKIRLGKDNDGGYIICVIPNINYDILISGGIKDDISFEEDFCNKYENVKCVAFDASIDNILTKNSNITFIKKYIGGTNDNNFTNLHDIIDLNNNIFIKMDIEGYEYDWICSLDDEQINKFSQIVIEIHKPFNFKEKNVFDKLNKNHILVHFHPNNACGIRNHKNIKIPNIFECTFINKKYYNEPYKLNDEKIPSSIDMPNVLNVSEININYPPFVFRKQNIYELSVMAIFKNETMNLKLWLDHYLWQGVQHFYLIDNNSTDNPLSILKEYIDKGIVTYYFRPEKYKQSEHYRYVFDKACLKEKTKWLCICDLDEFFFGTEQKLVDAICEFDEYNVIYTNSFFYGSDNLIEHPKDIRTDILHREEDIENGIKYIFKPKSINDSSEIWIHWLVNPGTLQKKQMNEITQNNKIRLNHYRIQSFEYYSKVKMTRGDCDVQKHDNMRDKNYFETYTKAATIKDDILKQIIENGYNIIDKVFNKSKKNN